MRRGTPVGGSPGFSRGLQDASGHSAGAETVDRRAALILNVVVGFPNEKGLTSILRCLGATSPGAEPLKSAVEASAQRIVAVSKESRNQEQWHSAIESFTSKTNTLIGGQRRVFESLQRAFATDAKESSK